MNFPHPQTHKITTLTTALEAGCDTVMPRHIGWPVMINCLGDKCQVFSDARFSDTQEMLYDLQPREPVTALFVGAKPLGTLDQYPIIVYDVWWLDGIPTKDLAFRQRYRLARTVCERLDERFKPVTIAPILSAETLWRQIPMFGWTGLVFRRSKDTAAGELYVLSYYPETPGALPV